MAAGGPDLDSLFFLWVASQNKRSTKRRRRGQMQDSAVNEIDNDFMRDRIEEAHVTEIGEYGQCFLHDTEADANEVLGCIVVTAIGGWQGHLTRSGGQRRWISDIYIIVASPSNEINA